MESSNQTLQSIFSETASELHLLIAVEIINNTLNDNTKSNEKLAKQALQYLRVQAAKGDVEAKIKLSTILDRKEDNKSLVVKNPKEATLWARSVFDRRLSAALAPCASELITLTEEAKEEENSIIERLIQRASHISSTSTTKKERKIAKSLSYLVGILYMDGTGVDQDTTKGMDFLSTASDSGHEVAGIELAKIMNDPYKYPKHYDVQKSLEIYESVAERKMIAGVTDARALTDLARVYYEGSQTIPRDIFKAYKYARKVAETKGEQYCQFIVGDVLLNPPHSDTEEIKQDIQQAIFWLNQSGQQGFPLAIETLSRIYFEGKTPGIKKDYQQAQQWCLLGDDIWPSGLGYCQTCLGDMYRQGLGVPKDQIRSFEYYQKAASQQDAPQNYARYMLGEMFFHADGWDQNLDLATDYYTLAANENYEPAIKRLEEIRIIQEEKRLKEKAAARRSWKFWTVFGKKKAIN